MQKESQKELNENFFSSIYLDIVSGAIILKPDRLPAREYDSGQNIKNINETILNGLKSFDDCVDLVKDLDTFMIKHGFYEEQNGIKFPLFYLDQTKLIFWKERVVFIQEILLKESLSLDYLEGLRKILRYVRQKIDSIKAKFKLDNIDLCVSELLKHPDSENAKALEEKMTRSKDFLEVFELDLEHIFLSIDDQIMEIQDLNIENGYTKKDVEEYLKKGGLFDKGDDMPGGFTRDVACQYLRRVRNSSVPESHRALASIMVGDTRYSDVNKRFDLESNNVGRYRKQVIKHVINLIFQD